MSKQILKLQISDLLCKPELQQKCYKKIIFVLLF